MESIALVPRDPAAPGEPALRIGVLGPLDVRLDGASRTPTAPQVRRVLAVLLLRAGRPVPLSALIEELWETDPPRLARKTVQTYVYQLRRALDRPLGRQTAERLETRTNGYLLRLRPEEVDLWDFERRVATARTALDAGRAQEAAGALREALALWRGDAFADVPAGPELAARVTRIEATRISALEMRVQADLQLGRHGALLDELRQLTAEHPLNERLAADLVLAAHRSGQRATALDAFTRLRRNLVRELGIEPSDWVRKLQQDVLSASPALGVPTPVHLVRGARPGQPDPAPGSVAPPGLQAAPAPVAAEVPPAPAVAAAPAIPRLSQLPPDTPDFTGRRRELERLLTLATPGEAAERRTAPRIVTVLGGIGAGKSVLAVRAAHLLSGRFPDGQLYARLHSDRETPLNPTLILRSFLRDLHLDSVPTSDGDPGGWAEDELARRFRDHTAGRALLLLLEDAASARQILPLLPGGDRSTVIATSRVRLPGLPGAAHLTVGPMSTDDGAALFSSVIGPERAAGHPAAVRSIVRLMGHVPLGIRAMGETLDARPMWSATDFAERLANESQRRVELRAGTWDVLARVEQSCARLPGRAREALTVLSRSVTGTFGVRDAAQLLGLPTDSAEQVLGILLDHHAVELGPLTYSAASEAASATFRIPELIRLALMGDADPAGRERAALAAPGPVAAYAGHRGTEPGFPDPLPPLGRLA
ncbi:AfsR/SARP family transcriptional regulator [Streptomyces sp. NBC_00249]|uniref:AfsR/SARP family transcriptional regulator n=1 Tax=Streptomyces sp. NBC_00249 TaxID=2975690 RepID=UPI00224E21B1|nr:AfsR/SARP family transcriptional regulator [Streptomyces sp. NBC_00249]MCX5197297.1 AfsR/SARP family transcriptional regulator [Streptomyces sp. NBC_00249]